MHIAISPQVTSAPKALQTLRKGRFPTVVKGARYNFPLKSISFFSRGCNFKLPSVSTLSAMTSSLSDTSSGSVLRGQLFSISFSGIPNPVAKHIQCETHIVPKNAPIWNKSLRQQPLTSSPEQPFTSTADFAFF